MSKIICEVCGTAYPETADQCPICGCSRPEEPKLAADDGAQSGHAGEGGYKYVKGGRFSRANVRKRQKAAQSVPQEPEEELPDDGSEPKSNRGLLLVLLLLLLAIAAVVIYIVVRFFVPMGLFDFGTNANTSTTTNTTTQSTPPTTEGETTLQTELDLSCTGLKLLDANVTLDSVGEAWLLEVKAQPEGCTDPITYSSSNSAVATVTSAGRVTAVGPGNAVITITCGSVTTECKVFCDIETTPPSEDTTVPETTEETIAFGLNRSDITLANKGDGWVLYEGSISKTLIIWTSDNPAVATFENGKVVAVGPGTTTVRAEYNGQRASCIIRCSFSDSEDSTEGTKPEADGTYTISHEDVTLTVGETFSLRLRDSNGDTVSVSWSVDDSSVCSISGNTVTALASGTTTVSVTYAGQTYRCIVRVHN